ncbi:hypothetical protein [Lentzea nigeriaca]|uniref:hypothetical protein n=1 Tax=Lentzea nigeriaca TaxID=1128665 RepID=UPI00195CB21F|nr:hypothetical protein [Lentzea nigeriaca]MBM7862713.1 hypothetical protein [Lentzea nigeriaca]
MDLTKGELVDFEGAGISAAVIRDLLVNADDLDPRGLRVRNARIEGQLDLRDVVAKRPLVLLDCTADAPVLLDRAHLSALDLSGLVAPAVIAPWLRLDHYLYLVGARLDGGEENYALDLAEASVGGHVNLSGANLLSQTGCALHAGKLRTGSDLYLNDVRTSATVELVGARIGGNLDCTGAELAADDGALQGMDLQVDGNILLEGGFHATSERYIAVRIRGSRIGGQLVLRNGKVAAPRAALDVKQVRVGMELFLSADFADGRVELDGLTYAGLPRDSGLDEWLDLLANKTPQYATQPYAQLAAAHQAAGHERDVRRIRVAQHRDLLRRGRLTRWGRVWHRITGATVGYGYRPATALLWLLGTLAVSAAVVLGSGAVRCSTVEQIGYALNAAAPLVKTDAVQKCQVATTTSAGQLVVVAMWILQLLAWAFATLFVAGFTGLVRKNP